MAGTMLAGCGGGGSSDDSGSGSTEEAAEGEEGEAEPEDVTTVGPDSGTKMEMWSFVSQHNDFYAKMLEKWNEQNPDRQIQITFTTYPFADMHNKLMMSLQTGEGAPDLCDIERGQFPNFLQGEVQLYALNDALAPYTADLVQSRLDIYSKDGNYYGAPTHVGATVMYYNDELLVQIVLKMADTRGMLIEGVIAKLGIIDTFEDPARRAYVAKLCRSRISSAP